MTISDLKRALVEVSEICKNLTGCIGCPFDSGKWYCPMQGIPKNWRVDELKEGTHETD